MAAQTRTRGRSRDCSALNQQPAGWSRRGPDGCAAAQLSERWHGDLRRLRRAADGKPGRIADLLTGFPGIGPAGASIFLREVQETWPSVGPYVDSRVTTGPDS
jgi:hypothetical protein